MLNLYYKPVTNLHFQNALFLSRNHRLSVSGRLRIYNSAGFLLSSKENMLLLKAALSHAMPSA